MYVGVLLARALLELSCERGRPARVVIAHLDATVLRLVLRLLLLAVAERRAGRLRRARRLHRRCRDCWRTRGRCGSRVLRRVELQQIAGSLLVAAGQLGRRRRARRACRHLVLWLLLLWFLLLELSRVQVDELRRFAQCTRTNGRTRTRSRVQVDEQRRFALCTTELLRVRVRVLLLRRLLERVAGAERRLDLRSAAATLCPTDCTRKT